VKQTIFTVSSVDVPSDNPIETSAIGSWTTRYNAAKACVDYMIERIGLRPDIRYAIFHDVNHSDVAERVALLFGGSVDFIMHKFSFDLDEKWRMTEKMEESVRDVLSEEFAISSIYEIETDPDSDIGCEKYIFEISQNELEE